jgi:hypothetical protein
MSRIVRARIVALAEPLIEAMNKNQNNTIIKRIVYNEAYPYKLYSSSNISIPLGRVVFTENQVTIK